MEENSILVSIKKMLGIDRDCEAFDQELIIFINSVFSTLYQIGFDSSKDYRIQSKDEEWTDILDDDMDLIDLIKPYIYMKVRMLFDPPTSSFVLESLKNQISEYEWRIQIQTKSEGGFDFNGDE